MCNHKLGLTEDGRANYCIFPDCWTNKASFVMAGGDATTGDLLMDESLSALSRAINEGVEVNSKIKRLEEENQKLKKENEELHKALKSFAPGFFGED